MPGFFPRVNAPVQAAAGWLAVLSAAYTVWTQNAPKYFGELTVSESILLSIALALATSLAVALALFILAYTYRLISPLPASPPVPPAPGVDDLPYLDHPPAAYDDTELRGEIAELNAVIEAGLEMVRSEAVRLVGTVVSARIGEGLQFDTVAETIEAVDARAGHQIELNEKRFAEAHETIQSVAGTMARCDTALSEKLDEEKKRINGIIDDNNRQAVQIERLEEHLKELKKATKKLPEALYAIYQREIITKAAADIEAVAASMYEPLHNGETYDEERWIAWEDAHNRWEALVRLWVENGRWYAPAVDARVFLVDDEKYGLDWTVKDVQFPDLERLSRSEAVRRFKKFRIIHTQWREVRDEVDRGIVQVAFIGMTAEEVRRRPGDER